MNDDFILPVELNDDIILPVEYGKSKCPAKKKLNFYGYKVISCSSPFDCTYKYPTVYGCMCGQKMHELKNKRKQASNKS